MNEAKGVKWAYLDPERGPYVPDSNQCAECGRWFQASQHFNDGDGHDYCPECHPVASMGHEIDEFFEEVDDPGPPEYIGVSDLMEEGDPR